jgi:hypothetical protein
MPARCDGRLNGWVSTVDNLQVSCMMGMHLPLSMRRTAGGQGGITVQGRGRGEGKQREGKGKEGIGRCQVLGVAAPGPAGW